MTRKKPKPGWSYTGKTKPIGSKGNEATRIEDISGWVHREVPVHRKPPKYVEGEPIIVEEQPAPETPKGENGHES